MFKYITTALLLKLFSISPITRQLYRYLGNTYGTRKRINGGLPLFYVNRAKQIIQLCRRYRAIQNGDSLLEIGTGWVHWESIVLRLFFDIHACVFDVWDNRQVEAMHHYFKQFADIIDREMDIDSTQSKRVHDLLSFVSGTKSFDDLYDLLGFKYVVNPQGTLSQFNESSFDLIVSSGVLEHVAKKALPDLVKDFHRLLKPGGFSFHHIVIADHLAMHDPGVSKKNYLRYSDRLWKRCFENQIQYFNRVQRPEWLCLFGSAGLELLEESPWTETIGPIKVDQQYIGLSQTDLECTVLNLVHKKP